jgi:hypothetical protein
MSPELVAELSGLDYLWNAEREVYDGPFKPGTAGETADKYNQFILEDVFKQIGVKAVGPWYPVKWERIPAPHQRKLARKYTS